MKGKPGGKGIARLVRPSMRLYFLVILVFTAAAIALRYWYLAIGELAVVLLLLFYTRLMSRRQKKRALRYVESSVHDSEDGSTSALINMPLPMVIFHLRDQNVLWVNETLLKLTGEREHTFEYRVDELIGDFSWDWLAEGKTSSDQLAVIGEKKYRVFGNLFRVSGNKSDDPWGMVYLVDVTDYADTAAEYAASRPVVAVLLLDNYEELLRNLDETEKSRLLAMIDHRIGEWSAPAKGYLCRFDRDRYVFIFEERYMPLYLENRFSILDAVRRVQNAAGIAATLSIGVGREAETLADGYRFAMLGVDMATSRGGDQAVVNSNMNYSFYGGNTVAVDRATKVKSRVMASAMGDLMVEAGNILVMGHRNADLDCIGAAAGIVCIARKRGRTARIVVDPEQNMAKQLIRQLKQQPLYREAFVSESEALSMADSRTLLVVVDTNRPDQVEAESLLQICGKVAVVDHHRRAADYIVNANLNFHEPYASSAAELVTELLQYMVEPKDILKIEAEAVLAGIVLDTKNFTMRTGSRTFEAAAFLRRSGSDTTEVKKLFQNDLESTVARYDIIRKAEIYRGVVAIAACVEQRDRVVASQAADELINLAGIDASFVLYGGEDGVNISGRSLDQINVQVILEKLGGGGNRNTAGAQIKGRSLDEVEAGLKAAIDEFLENDRRTEGNT